MPTPAREGQAHRRVVRRASLISRIKAYPLDLLLYINEELGTLEWDRLSETVALPAGVALDAVLFFSQLFASALNSSADLKGELFADGSALRNSHLADEVLAGRSRSGGFTRWMAAMFSALSLVILAGSFINALFVFTRRKEYAFFGRSAQDKKMNDAFYSQKSMLSLSEQSSPASSPTPQSSIRKAVNRAFSRFAIPEISTEETWVLKMWNPDQFCLKMFVTFSPLHALLLFFRSNGNLIRDCLLCVFLSVQMYILVTLFSQQVHDKQMVFSEMFEEYEQKAVRPKLSIVRREVAIGTDGSVDFHVPLPNRHFETHDIRPSTAPPSPLFGTPSSQSPLSFSTRGMPSDPSGFSSARPSPRQSMTGARSSFGSPAIPSHINSGTGTSSPLSRSGLTRTAFSNSAKNRRT
ncbi:hypothetical protein BZA70DRAFT_278213 [Myxozyma melibiosi]|uniref:Nuclear rim protein 1 n=1 Tax=Myxozyma melibiosi TaxID=54550 RepID=A0ABR1F8P6_9ASCO